MSPLQGTPSQYLKGCTVAKTLEGHGVKVLEGDGEDLDGLYQRICEAINTDGPVAVINKRPMCPGIEGLEGSTHGHDVISVELALKYLESNNQQGAADMLRQVEAPKQDKDFLGVSDTWIANRGCIW